MGIKIFVATIDLDYFDGSQTLRYELIEAFDSEEKAKAYISSDVKALFEEEKKSTDLLFESDIFDEAIGFSIKELTVK